MFLVNNQFPDINKFHCAFLRVKPALKNCVIYFGQILKLLLPQNKISGVKRRGCLDISVYSNYLENILGWEAKNGSKFVQKVTVPAWIKGEREFIISCLRGLFQTDGSLYNDRGYKMINFVTIIPNLAKDVSFMMGFLGYSPKTYFINTKTQTRYNIRLSKNVKEFIKTVGFVK